MAKEPTLFDVVNYMSGDSWNGTHDRSIEISYQDENHVLVENVYCSSRYGGTFTLRQLGTEQEKLRSARYYRDFCYEAERTIPKATGLRDSRGSIVDVELPETARMIEEAIAEGAGHSLAALKPLRFKLKM
jgi:hypothetical protein